MSNDQPAGDTTEDLMTVARAAEYKRVHRGTIYKAIREKRLRPFRPQKPYLIARVVLDTWSPQPHKGKRSLDR